MGKRGALVAALSAGFLGMIVPAQADDPPATTGCAAEMPTGFDWPADPKALYKISGGLKTSSSTIPGTIDVAAQRRHGWNLFAGITQPANGSVDSAPVFHTWYTVEEAFDPTPGKVDCSKRHAVLRLTLPTQLVMEVPNPARETLRAAGYEPSPRFDPDPGFLRGGKVVKAPLAAHDGVVAFSHVAFNKDLYEFIRDNRYYSKDVLNQLSDPSVARKPIADPPTTGISLKFSWWPISPTGLTPVPVWDGDPRFPGDAKNPPTSWKRVVVVDPVGGLHSPPNVKLGGFDHPNPKVVPLGRFYSVKVTADEAALANADFRIKAAATEVLGRPLQAGDFLALTAMHIATREFDPWVFLTYWWTDQPNTGPLAADMPGSVKGVFRNYVMDVSYNINAPKTVDGKAPVAFSPWLELFQKGGTRSQCMACHARAAYGQSVVAAFNPAEMSTADPNGFDATPQDAKDPAFQKGTISLHRIWTIFTRAQ